MITNTFVLDARFPDCTLTTYIHEPYPELAISSRRAMIVCPGGGYGFLSDREGEPVALQYFAKGLNVFVLRYSLLEKAARHAPLFEAALAVRYIRTHAAELYVNPDYVFISGFSAGGHVAASLATMWNKQAVSGLLGDEDPRIARPTAAVLCYPVITGGVYAHRGSIDAVCGKPSAGTPEADYWSLENQVDADTVPCFIWHTCNDTLVPIQNSVLFVSALAANGVPFEYHVFPDGVHGLSLANKETWVNIPTLDKPDVAGWMDMAARFVCEWHG